MTSPAARTQPGKYARLQKPDAEIISFPATAPQLATPSLPVFVPYTRDDDNAATARDRAFRSLELEVHQTITTPERRAEIIAILKAASKRFDVARNVLGTVESQLRYLVNHKVIPALLPDLDPSKGQALLQQHFTTITRARTKRGLTAG